MKRYQHQQQEEHLQTPKAPPNSPQKSPKKSQSTKTADTATNTYADTHADTDTDTDAGADTCTFSNFSTTLVAALSTALQAHMHEEPRYPDDRLRDGDRDGESARQPAAKRRRVKEVVGGKAMDSTDTDTDNNTDSNYGTNTNNNTDSNYGTSTISQPRST